MEKEIKLEQFIGIFPTAVNTLLCSEFVRWFNKISEQGITMSSMEQSGEAGIVRKDEVLCIPKGIPPQCFPTSLTEPLWENIQECLDIYRNEYNINDSLASYDFKIHRVQPSGGYHAWHHEHSYGFPHRTLVWMVIVESPERGGETEFLHQSMRVEPKVGQLAIWPAGFTHKHRGNPPLEGQKTYLTGWFNVSKQ